MSFDEPIRHPQQFSLGDLFSVSKKLAKTAFRAMKTVTSLHSLFAGPRGKKVADSIKTPKLVEMHSKCIETAAVLEESLQRRGVHVSKSSSNHGDLESKVDLLIEKVASLGSKFEIAEVLRVRKELEARVSQMSPAEREEQLGGWTVKSVSIPPSKPKKTVLKIKKTVGKPEPSAVGKASPPPPVPERPAPSAVGKASPPPPVPERPVSVSKTTPSRKATEASPGNLPKTHRHELVLSKFKPKPAVVPAVPMPPPIIATMNWSPPVRKIKEETSSGNPPKTHVHELVLSKFKPQPQSEFQEDWSKPTVSTWTSRSSAKVAQTVHSPKKKKEYRHYLSNWTMDFCIHNGRNSEFSGRALYDAFMDYTGIQKGKLRMSDRTWFSQDYGSSTKISDPKFGRNCIGFMKAFFRNLKYYSLEQPHVRYSVFFGDCENILNNMVDRKFLSAELARRMRGAMESEIFRQIHERS